MTTWLMGQNSYLVFEKKVKHINAKMLSANRFLRLGILSLNTLSTPMVLPVIGGFPNS